MDTNQIGNPIKVTSPINEQNSPIPEIKEQSSTIQFIVNLRLQNQKTTQETPLLYHVYYYEQGENLFKKGEYEKAIRCFKNAIEKAPNEPNYWNYLGIAQSNCHQHQQAITSFMRSTIIDPKNSLFWNNLGNEYGIIDKKKEAIEAFANGLQYTHNPLVLGNLIREVNNHAGFEKAQETFNFYTPNLFNENESKYWSSLGSIFLNPSDEKHCQVARYCYKQAIKIDQTNVEDWRNLAQSYAFVDREVDAIELLLIAKEKFPNDSKTFWMLGNYYFNIRKYSEAIENLEKAVYMPNASSHLDHLLEVYLESGKDNKAIELAKKLINEERDEARIYPRMVLGMLYEQYSNTDLAVRYYKEAAEIDVESDKAPFKLGHLYLKLRDYKNAILHFEKCVEIDPNYENYKHLGLAYFASNDFENAKKYLLQTLEFDVDQKMINQNLFLIQHIDKQIKNSK